MKVAVIFVLLFATVLCRPARKVSDSSSESSEEVVRRPAVQAVRKQAPVVPQARAAPVQNIVAAAAAGSDESSDEDEQVEVKSDSTDATSESTTASVNSNDSEDSDDDDDDEEEAEESETEEEEDESNSESGESSTPAPATVTPVVVTEGPAAETTAEPIVPTIVTDTETARGDNLGGYPSEYKSIYVEDKSYHKVPVPYKSYEFVDTGKKTAYDVTDGNEVEKSLKVYKVQAIHVHSDLLEEDTSTPEVESQGLDASSGTSQDISPRQASLPEEEESASTSDATSESESTSTPEEEEAEEEEESASTTSDSDSASASQDEEDEESQSSEEATATPGAADSDSDESDSAESDSDEEGAGPDIVTDIPPVITAK